MDIHKIIVELSSHHPYKFEGYEQLKGGTVSEVYLLKFNGLKLVVKVNDASMNEPESTFLQLYKNSTLLPKLQFVDPTFKYIVYSYIDGSTQNSRKNKAAILKTLVQGLINLYKETPDKVGFGWANQPVDSWQKFLLDEIDEAKIRIASQLSPGDYQFVQNIVRNSTNSGRYLLHGDCGVHNFIFNNTQLTGVIDPSPVIGDPLYDLIYAFCSTPDDLTIETIDSAVRHLAIKGTIKPSYVYEQVMIGLYIRLGICLKHHPQDVEDYVKAWNDWKISLFSIK